jgi:hypothetical protein
MMMVCGQKAVKHSCTPSFSGTAIHEPLKSGSERSGPVDAIVRFSFVCHFPGLYRFVELKLTQAKADFPNPW